MKKALLISCFEEWYKDRLEPICDILANSGYSIKCVLSDYNHIGKRYSEKKEEKCDYIHVPKYKSNISLHRIWSHLVFGRKVNTVIQEYKPDLLYLVLPPNNTARYCIKYKKENPKARLIIDIIDLWPESMPLGKLKNTSPAKMWMRWRDGAVRIADRVFTECDLYQEKLRRILIPSKTTTLHLYKEQTDEERRLVREIIEKKKNDDVIRFAYLGSMNSIIDIDGICGVIQSFVSSGKTCELHAIGDGESRDKFEDAVKSTGCKTQFYGPVFDELEKIRILAPCDYAFNMMKGNITVGLTIKSIDYLSYGLPLINNIKGDTWKLVEDEGIGINISITDSIDLLPLISHKQAIETFIKKFTIGVYNLTLNDGLNDFIS